MISQKLRGLVGQGMGGAKKGQRGIQLVGSVDVSSGTGSVTATVPCFALIYAWGGGASGDGSAANSGGGGGGAAVYKRIRLSVGQSISYSVGAAGAFSGAGVQGNDGGDTTVTLPRGLQGLVAGGGKAGIGNAGGAGGIASGGNINRNGGAGGTSNTAGGSPTYGGAGGTGGGPAGGGGAAGFSDLGTALLGGAGGSAGSGTPGTPGGGSGGSATGSVAGKAGRVFIALVRPI